MRYGRWFRSRAQAAVVTAVVVAGMVSALVSGTAFGLGGAPAASASECSSDTTAVPVPGHLANELRCLPIGGSELDGSRVDATYSHAASDVIARAALADAVADRMAIVVCWSEEDWARIGEALESAGTRNSTAKDAFVDMPSSIANLSPETCEQLDRVAYDGKRYESSATAIAVGTLAHEAIHVAGVADEAIAECYGAQLVAAAAVGIGTSLDHGAALEQSYWERNRWFLVGTEYDSDECRAGGELDLQLGSTIWS